MISSATVKLFSSHLQTAQPGRKFTLLATCGTLDDEEDVVIAGRGWLAHTSRESSEPAGLRYGRAKLPKLMVTVRPLHASDDSHDVALKQVPMEPCTQWIPTDAVHVGMTWYLEGSEQVYAGMAVWIDVPACWHWWRMYSTVPNAYPLASMLMASMPEVNLAIHSQGELFTSDTPSTLLNWMAAKESEGTALTYASFAKDDTMAPLFHEDAPADQRIYLDLLTGCVSLESSHMLLFPPAVSSARGGLLTGLPGTGKFTAVLSYIKSLGVTKTACEPEESTMLTIPHKGTLLVVPAAAAESRLAQTRAACPNMHILELLKHAQLEACTWTALLQADIIILSVGLLISPAYKSHAAMVLCNLVWYPAQCQEMYQVLSGFLNQDVVPAETGRRKRARRELEPAIPPQHLHTAMSYFDLKMDAALADTAAGAPHPYSTPSVRLLGDSVHTSMAAPAANQLARLPSGWQDIIHNPVLELISFARVVFADLQHCQPQHLKALHCLQGKARWATDSAADTFWLQQVAQWEVLLPPQLRHVSNNAKFHALTQMTAVQTHGAATLELVVDKVPRLLPETCEDCEEELDEEDEELPLKIPAVNDLEYVPPKQVVFLEPEACLLEILAENERRFIKELASAAARHQQQEAGQAAGGESARGRGLTIPLMTSMGPTTLQIYHSADDVNWNEAFDLLMADSPFQDDDDDEDDSSFEGSSSAGDNTDSESGEENGDTDSKTAESEEGAAESKDGDKEVVSQDVPPTPHMIAQTALCVRVREALTSTMWKQPCSICHVDVCNCFLSCGHAFCLMCIQPQLTMNHACPVCIRPCWFQAPLFVPQTTILCPPPAFCKEDPWAQNLWREGVCTTASNRVSSLKFWVLTHLHAAQVSPTTNGKGVVVVTNSVAHCQKARRLLNGTPDVWPVESHDSSKGRRAFAVGKCHTVIQRAHIMGGVRISNVHTVLLLCEMTAAEQAALARRLSAAGTSVCLRSCVYSSAPEGLPL
jgi:hypothetical protein